MNIIRGEGHGVIGKKDFLQREEPVRYSGGNDLAPR